MHMGSKSGFPFWSSLHKSPHRSCIDFQARRILELLGWCQLVGMFGVDLLGGDNWLTFLPMATQSKSGRVFELAEEISPFRCFTPSLR